MKKLITLTLIFFAFTTYAQKYTWSYDDKKEFITECLEVSTKDLGEFMNKSEQSKLCDCALYKIQDEVKNKTESDLLDDEELGIEIIMSCLPKGWSYTVTKMMIEECEKDASEDFCRCYLENMKKRFPDFWEFSLLAAEGKITEEMMQDLTLPCVD